MSKCETKFDSYFKLPNPGLRSYFDRVLKGQPDEYRTPFYKGKSLDQLVSGWATKLAPLKTQWPTLYDLEIDQSKKVGPLSIQKPLKERMDDIDSYYESILRDSKPLSEAALTATAREWSGANSLRIRSEARTVEVMKKSTNSGSPFFTKRRLVVKRTIPTMVWQDGLDTFQSVDNKIWNACAVLGWRGQEGGPSFADVKQRVIWMFPFAVNIAELRAYQPLIEAFQRLFYVPAWVGADCVDLSITDLFDMKGKKDLVICTDFTKFDQHFNKDCQNAARWLLKELFMQDRSMDEWLERVFPIKYGIPLAYDMGKIRKGLHGMGSGSGGTNVDETLVHRALQHEAALNAGKTLNPDSQCLGDDGILSYPGCSVDQVMQAYTSHGLEMNEDKQYASTHDCVYLRRWHHTDYRVSGVCVGVYPTMRALGRLAEQERYYDPDMWSREMVALRQLSILENVKWHPLREEFVDYCMKGDMYRLGLDIPGFLDNIDSIAQEAIDVMPDFLGYTRSLQSEGKDLHTTGIATWWIVKHLKSMR